MKPLPRFERQCRDEFTIGGVYRFKLSEDGSDESYGHFFACVRAAFDNLPELYADRFASAEHLRHWCLIKGDYPGLD